MLFCSGPYLPWTDEEKRPWCLLGVDKLPEAFFNSNYDGRQILRWFLLQQQALGGSWRPHNSRSEQIRTWVFVSHWLQSSYAGNAIDFSKAFYNLFIFFPSSSCGDHSKICMLFQREEYDWYAEELHSKVEPDLQMEESIRSVSETITSTASSTESYHSAHTTPANSHVFTVDPQGVPAQNPGKDFVFC